MLIRDARIVGRESELYADPNMTQDTIQTDLISAFGIRQGDVVSFVGAGGKKTTISALALAFPGSVGVTTTVRTLIPDDIKSIIIEPEISNLFRAIAVARKSHQKVTFASELERGIKIRGFSKEQIDSIAGESIFDLLLVKADGALKKRLKAPAEYEPQIPVSTTEVVIVVPVSVVGRPLVEEHVHRLNLLQEILGIEAGETIEAVHLAKLICSKRGYLKDVPKEAKVVLLLNMADNEELVEIGREIAGLAMRESIRLSRAILAQMDQPKIIDVMAN